MSNATATTTLHVRYGNDPRPPAEVLGELLAAEPKPSFVWLEPTPRPAKRAEFARVHAGDAAELESLRQEPLEEARLWWTGELLHLVFPPSGAVRWALFGLEKPTANRLASPEQAGGEQAGERSFPDIRTESRKVLAMQPRDRRRYGLGGAVADAAFKVIEYRRQGELLCWFLEKWRDNQST